MAYPQGRDGETDGDGVGPDGHRDDAMHAAIGRRLRVARPLAAAVLLTALAAPVATAKPTAAPDPDRSCNGPVPPEPADGGTGGLPLRLEFTDVHGTVVAGVTVVLKDAEGRVLAEAHCAAPRFLARVAPGEYTAELTAPGEPAKIVTFTVDADDDRTRVVVPFGRIGDA